MRALVATFIGLVALLSGCSHSADQPTRQTSPRAQKIVLVTIDTLRADHVGAYGYAAGAHAGARRARARRRRFRPRLCHGADHADLAREPDDRPLPARPRRPPQRHAPRPQAPTLAEAFARAGYATGGLRRGVPAGSPLRPDQGLPDLRRRDAARRRRPPRQRTSRPAVVDEALAWLERAQAGARSFSGSISSSRTRPTAIRRIRQQAKRPAIARYDDDIAEADAQVGRLLDGLGERDRATLIVVAGDHGEAFGEHGEISHSIFTYDTTLRVPLIMPGAGVSRQGAVVKDAMLARRRRADGADALPALGAFDADGDRSLPPAIRRRRRRLRARALYAESFAPLLDFGWSPLRTIRSGGLEIHRRAEAGALRRERRSRRDATTGSTRNRSAPRTSPGRVDAISTARLPATATPLDRDSLARLQALGYASRPGRRPRARADPKDRRDEAARLAQITSGELQGAALERALRAVLKRMRTTRRRTCDSATCCWMLAAAREAMPHFNAAIAHHLPTADAHLGRAGCQLAAKDLAAARAHAAAGRRPRARQSRRQRESRARPLGQRQPAAAIPHLQRALSLDPDLHQARFGLALAYARAGRRADAAGRPPSSCGGCLRPRRSGLKSNDCCQPSAEFQPLTTENRRFAPS